MIIYLLRNKINGKGYVGLTIGSLDVRWRQHCNGKQAIDLAIKKYGKDNFERCVLAEAHSLLELNELEIFHIKSQGTLSPDGYNLHTGGFSHEVTEEARQNMSEAHLGQVAWNKGTRGVMRAWNKGTHMWSDEERKQIGERQIGRVPWNRGRPMSLEQRHKLSIAHTGIKLSSEHCAAQRAGRAAKRGQKMARVSRQGI